MTREMAAQRPLSHRKPQTMELPKQMSSFRGKWTFLSIKITTFIVRCCVHTRRNALKTFKSHLGIWRRILSLMFRVSTGNAYQGTPISCAALIIHPCLPYDRLIWSMAYYLLPNVCNWLLHANCAPNPILPRLAQSIDVFFIEPEFDVICRVHLRSAKFPSLEVRSICNRNYAESGEDSR